MTVAANQPSATISVVDPETGEIKTAPFALEPSPTETSPVPASTIEELRHARMIAKDYATAFAEACKAQAEKYGIKPGALKRYIAALCDDKVDEAEAEAKDLERLIG